MKKRWSRSLKIMSRQHVLKELPAGTALLFAGSQYCPDVCILLSAHQGTAGLSNPPVNNSLTRRFLSGIIGSRHSRIKQKPENSFAMLMKTLSERGRLSWQILLFGNLFFKFRNALKVKLFFFGNQFSSTCNLLWLLLDERGPPLEKNSSCQLVSHL
jgi:hypothetical protein